MHRPVKHLMCPYSSSQASRTGLSDGTRRSRLPSSGAVGFIVGGPSAESHKRLDDCVTLGFGEKLPALGSAMKGWLVVNPFTMARGAIKVLAIIQRGAAG